MALVVKVFHQKFPLCVFLPTTGIEIKTRISDILEISGVVIKTRAMTLLTATHEIFHDHDVIAKFFTMEQLRSPNFAILIIEIDANYTPKLSVNQFINTGAFIPPPKCKKGQDYPRGTNRRKSNLKYWVLDHDVEIPRPTTEKRILTIKDPKNM